MKIAAAQTKPAKADIEANIIQHKKFIAEAIAYNSDLILFPELSITGYEPEFAKQLATTSDDLRFNEFQKLSDSHRISIAIGMPIKNDSGIFIGMVIFQPEQARTMYSKRYLHPDEEPFFINGNEQVFLNLNNHIIAPAICYELSVSDHAKNAHNNGSDIYVVSVAKTEGGMQQAAKILSNTAAAYSMIVVLSNCIGYCDNFLSGGKSSVWNKKGQLVGQLNDLEEGLLVFDTETGEVTKSIL